MAYVYNPLLGLGLDQTGAGGGASVAGSDTEIQYNDGGSLGASADLTWDDTGKVLGVGGDIDLDDGGTYTTTLQTITPTAARTISFPDATGTVGLVGGSSGNLVVNQSGAYAGVANSSVDNATGNITLGSRFISSLNGAASAPPGTFTGTWFTGGTATTTKPQVLIEPTGATSTAWSTSGTGLGVNAASGFAGNLLDLQVNGTSQARFTKEGTLAFGASTTVQPSTAGVGNWVGTLALFGSAGSLAATISSVAVNLSGSHSLEWGSDTRLFRDAANILAQRNGTNAQTSRVYNTYTSSTSYERAKLEWSSNVLRIGTEKGSAGGTARDMELQTDGTTRITVKADGAILFSGVPTSNPAVAGQLWNDGGTLKISAG